MCNHAFGEELDGCRIVADPVTGVLKCWANRPPRLPLPRTPVQERLAALGQGGPIKPEVADDDPLGRSRPRVLTPARPVGQPW
jgi:hypothetical protein